MRPLPDNGIVSVMCKQLDALDAYKIGYRSLEAILGTLDHVVAIEDEAQLIDFVGTKLAKAIDDLKDHEYGFDLRWKADMRAIKRWRAAHPGNELVMPDHADLCVFLLEEFAKLVNLSAAFYAKVKTIEPEVNKYIGLHFARTQQQYNGPNYAEEANALEAYLKTFITE